jgi:hypothetical protein
LLAATTLAFTAAFAHVAGPEGAFDLSWHTFDGGGGSSAGGAFTVEGTIGQPDAGAPLTGGTFEVRSGFWPGGIIPVPLCPADVNGDDIINITDLLAVIANWGATGSHPADVNGDNTVNVTDLLAVIAAWGLCPG